MEIKIGTEYDIRSIAGAAQKHPNPIFRGVVVERQSKGYYKIDVTEYNITERYKVGETIVDVSEERLTPLKGTPEYDKVMIKIGAIYNIKSITDLAKRHPNPIFQAKVIKKLKTSTSGRHADIYTIEVTAYNIGSGGPSIGKRMELEAERLISLVEDNKINARHVLAQFKEDEWYA
jgi:hypothetical protein